MSLNLFDMHCHLGFCPDSAAAARELALAGIGAFSNTVTPAEFEGQQAALAGGENVRVGVGLHPWWVAAGGTFGDSAGLDRLRELVAANRFVGEVGLDFSSRHVCSREAQVAAFSVVAKASAQAGGRVLSVHAVRSAAEILDVLEAAGALSADAGCACIMHWFSGSSDDLTCARRLGCHFSVNPRMLESKRGRAYVAAIPLDRLTLETDLPSSAGEPLEAAEIRQKLERVCEGIAKIRGLQFEEVFEATAYNSRQLLGL